MSAEMEETIFVARGILPEGQRVKASRFLGQLGMTVQEVRPEVLEEFNHLLLPNEEFSSYYNLGEIVSPEQYLGKEHVHTFYENCLPESVSFHRNMPTLAFSNMVRPKQVFKELEGQEHDLERFGLVVDTRDRVGFPPLSEAFASAHLSTRITNSVVQVGSVISFIELLRDQAVANQIYRLGNPKSSQRKFLDLLAAKLKEQIEQARV
jgi:hypothetical protein